jgi:3-isopropylmalate dehydrogenase
MMLRYTLNQTAAADRIESAVKSVLSAGLRTADIWSDAVQGTKQVGTREMGDAVVAAMTATTTTKTITTKSS